MNYAHIHLILNHIPIVGLGIVLYLLVIAKLRNSMEINRAAWMVLILVGIATIFTYLSGNFAEDTAQNFPDLTQEMIETHEERALIASILSILSAILAGVCLWMDRSKGSIPQRLIVAILLIVIVAFGAMIITANAGGQMRHIEIRPGASF
jgi:uncharacterized membrane protein